MAIIKEMEVNGITHNYYINITDKGVSKVDTVRINIVSPAEYNSHGVCTKEEITETESVRKYYRKYVVHYFSDSSKKYEIEGARRHFEFEVDVENCGNPFDECYNDLLSREEYKGGVYA